MKSIAKYTKKAQGITLITLIITIILALILASVTINTGINTYENSKINHFVMQMQLLQAKIDNFVTTQEFDNVKLLSVTTQQQRDAINCAYNNGEVTTNNISEYKVFTVDDIFNMLDVDGVQDDIMVNLNTREIVSLTGIEYRDKVYYTQYKLPEGQMVH